MSRTGLLQLLIAEKKKNEDLELQLKEAEEKLRNRTILLSEAGSIAEAALQINGVFQAAEEAAKQYLDSIAEIQKQAETIYEAAHANAQAEAEAIIAAANAYSERIRFQTDSYMTRSRPSSTSKPQGLSPFMPNKRN